MAKQKCWECNGTYHEKMVDFILYGVSLGKFKAKVCDKCIDTIFDELASEQIDVVAKQKGLWDLESRTKVGKVGNSLDIKLSKKLSDFADLRQGKDVLIYPESKKRFIVEIN